MSTLHTLCVTGKLRAVLATSLFVTYDVFFSDRPANCDTMVNGVCTDCANGYVLVAADGGLMACGGKLVFNVHGLKPCSHVTFSSNLKDEIDGYNT